MKAILNKIKNLVLKLTHFLPQRLPIGMTEHTKWVDSIIDVNGFKGPGYPDKDTIRFVLSTMTLHLGSTESKKPKRYFAKALIKGMANQVSSQVINEVKAKQEAERQEAAKKQAEATAQAQQAASNESVQK